MALPETQAAYADCYTIFERATTDPAGIRVRFDNDRDANFFKIRMNKARAIQRRQSAKMYPVSDPAHGKSEFDGYAVRSRRDPTGTIWIYVEPYATSPFVIENLSETLPLTPPDDLPPDFGDSDVPQNLT
jgi:hypothetical protein